MPSYIPFVRTGRLLGQAIPFKEGNVSDTYRGMVLPEAGSPRGAVIKDLPAKELANEVMAAALASFVGLPVPEPFLVRTNSADLNASKGPALDDGSRLVFASMDVQQPNVAALFRAGQTDAVKRRLAQWADLGRLYGFDALVANIDRHEGNLLFSGNGKVWLIDHGYCFGGPAWTTADLDPTKAYPHRLRDWLTPGLSNGEKSAAMAEAATVPQAFDGCDLDSLGVANYVSDMLDKGEFDALINFLQERRPYVDGLTANALGLVA